MIGQNGFILENQLELPFLALDAALLSDWVAFHAAIQLGYRHFLLAPNGKNAAAIRKLLQNCPLPRRELFLSMELDAQANLPQETERLLREMDAQYFDLLLLRRPKGDLLQNWQDMEEIYDVGAARSIGVSGFRPQRLLPLLRKASIRPMADLLPFSSERASAVTTSFCLSHGIQCLGRLPNPPAVPAMFSEKYGKTSAQLSARLALQNNILPLLPAMDAAEMRAAMAVFDFELSSEDFYALLTLGE